MKPVTRLILLSLLLGLAGLAAGQAFTGFNDDWKFKAGDIPGASEFSFDDTGWMPVDIPHDWAITGPFSHELPANTGKFPWKGVGWYRKHFELKSLPGEAQVYLLFDGVMAFPEVYVNGSLAGSWDYGYNSFYLNVTPYIKPGNDNVIAVRADTRQHDSRWYPGAGIFRKIHMLITGPVHTDIWGTWIQTPSVTDTAAVVHVYTTLVNHRGSHTEASVVYQITAPDGLPVDKSEKSVSVPGNGTKIIDAWLKVPQPERWDVSSPNLYRLVTVVAVPGVAPDSSACNFGIRTFRFTEDDGFWLNGRRLRIQGVNLHHDQGLLGAKFYARAMERQLEMLKQMGCNAIRTSHNVPAPELLDLCDRMGMLVFNEAFDKWDRKADYLPGNDFREFAERNIRNFVTRDRNHPSVVIWSVGNEMGDVQFNIDGGFDRLSTMVGLVRKYDATRPVTMAADAKGSAPWRHFDLYDVQSWNYGRRYLPARALDTTRAVIISESASTVSTRGFYELPLPAGKTDFTLSLQVSSYDLNAPEWAELADDDFAWQEEDPFVCGEFVWTGFDYLGEPTPYNDEAVKSGWITREQSARSSYFGIIDLCGIPKDRYFLYRSHWLPEEPTVHILPHWNWEKEKTDKIPVFVYTNGDCTELLINGRSMGKKCKSPGDDSSVKRYRLIWDQVPYEPGELKAIAYKDGQPVGVDIVKTAGPPAHLKLTPDRQEIRADGEDICYILAEAYDRNGNPCPLAENKVEFRVEGAASFEAAGNGDPQCMTPFNSSTQELFFGKAMLVIRSRKGEAGKVRITATSDGLAKASVWVNTMF